MRRVVITGVGIVSVLGVGRAAVTESLYTGRSGLGLDPARSNLGFRSPLTGILPKEAECTELSKKARKTMPAQAIYAHTALSEAIAHAHLCKDTIANERCGLVLGNDSSVAAVWDEQAAYVTAGTTDAMGSSHVFRCMNSCASMNADVLLGILGPTWTVSAACASGAFAIGQACDQIRLGRLDRVLAGGVQELNWQSVAAFDGLGAFSVNPDPAKASRPFDAARDGLVPSGGAAALVLEDAECAAKRGVPILGEIVGFGMSSDGTALSAPNPAGLARAIRAACREAGIQRALEIDAVSAHATSTVLGDRAEAESLKTVFGTDIPKVTALKGLTGHEFWMSGASQLVYWVCMAQAGFTAGTANFQAPGQGTEGIPVRRDRSDVPAKTVLHNACGFGGTNAALLVRYASA